MNHGELLVLVTRCLGEPELVVDRLALKVELFAANDRMRASSGPRRTAQNG